MAEVFLFVERNVHEEHIFTLKVCTTPGSFTVYQIPMSTALWMAKAMEKQLKEEGIWYDD